MEKREINIRYFNGYPHAVHIGKVPEGAPVGEYRPLPTYWTAWVASGIVEQVMVNGADTHPGQDYRTISYEENLAHLKTHLDLLFDGDTSEPHLDHILARAAMAAETKRRGPVIIYGAPSVTIGPLES